MSQISESFFPSIRKDEFLPLFKSFIFFFFVLASWYALRPVRNEMAIEGGIFNLPYILLAIVIVMGLINPIYSWVVSKIKTSRIVIYCYSFFILNLILFLLCWSFILLCWVRRGLEMILNHMASSCFNMSPYGTISHQIP